LTTQAGKGKVVPVAKKKNAGHLARNQQPEKEEERIMPKGQQQAAIDSIQEQLAPIGRVNDFRALCLVHWHNRHFRTLQQAGRNLIPMLAALNDSIKSQTIKCRIKRLPAGYEKGAFAAEIWAQVSYMDQVERVDFGPFLAAWLEEYSDDYRLAPLHSKQQLIIYAGEMPKGYHVLAEIVEEAAARLKELFA
jgi:hypothetical protein